jgi:hypothetical protein
MNYFRFFGGARWHKQTLRNLFIKLLQPVHSRSAVSRRGRQCLFSSVYGQLRGERRRLSDHRLIPTIDKLYHTNQPATPKHIYQLTLYCVSMDRHRHSCNERAVRFSGLLIGPFAAEHACVVYVLQYLRYKEYIADTVLSCRAFKTRSQNCFPWIYFCKIP